MSSHEIWKFLDTQAEPKEVNEFLDKLVEDKAIEIKNGFYFLPGQEKMVYMRLDRIDYAHRKYRIARAIAKFFKLIPWIKFMGIGNLMGQDNLRDESDIDIFIITNSKRLYLTRFFCVVITKLLGLRPRKNNTRDKICLSFYVSEDGLDLENLRIADDIYFTHWLAHLMPIINKDNTYNELIKTNTWLNQALPNWYPQKLTPFNKGGRGIFPPFSKEGSGVVSIMKKILNFLETKSKNFQHKKFPKIIKENINKNTNIVVTDSIIKLHVDDRREEYRNKWKKINNA